VSDDTIYRALKKLGFSRMSARPKAYKHGEYHAPNCTGAPQRIECPEAISA
jgi:hypothetical protein